MGISCPLAVPLLYQGKSANFKGVTLDLYQSAEIAVAVWKTGWCYAHPFVALYCTTGVTCHKGEGQSPTGTAMPQHMGDPMVTDVHAALLLAWMKRYWQNGNGPLPPKAGWQMWRRTQRQGKCRVDLKFCPPLQLSPCSLWRAARVKLRGMGCVPYYAK